MVGIGQLRGLGLIGHEVDSGECVDKGGASRLVPPARAVAEYLGQEDQPGDEEEQDVA